MMKNRQNETAPVLVKKPTASRRARTNAEIKPFVERPADLVMKSKEKSELGASELFSHFTADIIREDVLFTR